MARQPKQQPRHAPVPEAQFTRNRVVVIAVSMLAMLVAAGLAWLAMSTVPKSLDISQMLPIREVVFVGEIERVDANELKRVAGGIRGSMLHTDLNDVKAAIKQIHWVRNADVRRRFPGTLEVSLEEQRPFAKWKQGEAEQLSLVNTFGEVFEADLDDALPIFSGPSGAAKEVLAAYNTFKAQLAPISLAPHAISLSARRAWQLALDNGVVLQLGRSEAGERLARFVRSYPVVPALQAANARVDMRYQSGMAIKVGEVKPAATDTRKSTKKITTKS